MAQRLDVVMREDGVTNCELAEELGYSPNHISAVRNGLRPGLALALALCKRFGGRVSFPDLGIDIPADRRRTAKGSA